MNKIKAKKKVIGELLDQIREIVPQSFNEYKQSLLKKAACERLAEKMMQAVVDLAFLVIAARNLSMPVDDQHVFSILAGAGIIEDDLGKRLHDAKGMRNVIIHQYEEIDDEIVYEAITDELPKDIPLFLEKV